MRISANRVFEHLTGPVREEPTDEWTRGLTDFFARGNRVMVGARTLTQASQVTGELRYLLDDLMEAEGAASACDFRVAALPARYSGAIDVNARARAGGTLPALAPPTVRNGRFG